MVKKLAALAGAGALLLSMAIPVFAHNGDGPWWGWDYAYVNNSAVSVADTGGNTQNTEAWNSGNVYADGSRFISTGPAFAYAEASVEANTHIGCGFCYPYDDYYYGWHEDVAYVWNDAVAMASTGHNEQDAEAWNSGDVDADGSRTIYTGPASSTARAWTIVNTHWGGF